MLTTYLDLMRHGEPLGGSKIRGQSDDPLSAVGWQQMRAQIGDDCPWHAVVSSPLSRCSAFAREIAARFELPLEFDDRLKEIGFGVWEGRARSELTAADPDALRRFWRDPLRYAPPGAEPLLAFQARITQAWHSVLLNHAGRRVLVVCHAGVIRMGMCHALGFPVARVFQIKVPYAGITRFQVEHDDVDATAYVLSHAGGLATAPG